MPLNPTQLKQLISSHLDTDLQSLSNIVCANLQTRADEEAIIFAIENLLANANTRVRGLELLCFVLPHFSLSGISEHALNWASQCKICHSNETKKEIKIKTLSK